MRTREWFETRVDRARQRIMAECKPGTLGLGTLFSALGEITDDPPHEGDARLLAEALGCLSPDVYRFLVDEARRSVDQEVEHGVTAALRQIAESRSADSVQSLSALRAQPSIVTPFPSRPALVLQALIWAVLPPERQEPLVCY